MLQLMSSEDVEEQTLAVNIHLQREETVYRTVVDYARAHLPEIDDPNDQSIEKKNLRLIWGAWHELRIRQKFEDVGIEAATTLLDITDKNTREAEHVADVMVRNIAAVTHNITQALFPLRMPGIFHNSTDQQPSDSKAFLTKQPKIDEEHKN